MKKWSLQMRSLGLYIKDAVKIEGKNYKGITRVVFILLSALFFGAFFVWFNDKAAIQSSTELNNALAALEQQITAGDLTSTDSISAVYSAMLPLTGQLVRQFIIPLLTIIVSFVFTIPFVYASMADGTSLNENIPASVLIKTMFLRFGRHILLVLGLLLPLLIVSIFGGEKYFFDFGLITAALYSVIYILAFFTLCFQMDFRDTDFGCDYPYSSVARKVKQEMNQRISEDGSTDLREEMSDMHKIVEQIEIDVAQQDSPYLNKKSPFQKAWILFKLSWGRLLLMTMIIQFLVPIIQTGVLYVSQYTHRDLVVYCAIAFATAFMLLLESRFFVRVYNDLVHGVENTEVGRSDTDD